MTLCIAGNCLHEGKPAVVVCADTQGTDFAKSHDTYKIFVSKKSHSAIMFCDSVSAARELMAEISPIIDEPLCDPDLDDTGISGLISTLKTFTRDKLTGIRRDFMLRRYGLDFTEFYGHADADMKAAVGALSLDCELLICKAAPKVSMILHVTSDGAVRWQDSYHAIGSGYYLARAFLSQKNWEAQKLSVIDAASWLQAAKEAAERDVHVGAEKTQLAVLLAGKPVHSFTDEGHRAVDDAMPRVKVSPPVPTLPEYLRKTFRD